MYDVQQNLYPTVIREMIRHANDVTNQSIMWLLVGQGFVINAYVSAKNEVAPTHAVLSLVGILVSLKATRLADIYSSSACRPKKGRWARSICH
jgi:hypothetical protein